MKRFFVLSFAVLHMLSGVFFLIQPIEIFRII